MGFDGNGRVATAPVFTPAERTLLDAGRAEEVLASRSAIAHAAQEQLCEVVEQATGRKVRGFTSGVDSERDVATNVFLFD